MARKTSSRKTPAARPNYQSRDFLLAGIGAVSLGRKQFIQTCVNGFDGVVALRDRTQEAVQAAASTLQDQVGGLRKQAGSFGKQAGLQADQFRRQATQLREQAQAKIAPVIAPVLERFGMSLPKPKPRRAAAKKRPAARRRKAA